MGIERTSSADHDAEDGHERRSAGWRPPVDQPGTEPEGLSRADSRAAAAAAIRAGQRETAVAPEDPNEGGRRATGRIGRAPSDEPTDSVSARDAAAIRDDAKDTDDPTGADDASDRPTEGGEPSERARDDEGSVNAEQGLGSGHEAVHDPSEEELQAFAELGETRYVELKAKGDLPGHPEPDDAPDWSRQGAPAADAPGNTQQEHLDQRHTAEAPERNGEHADSVADTADPESESASGNEIGRAEGKTLEGLGSIDETAKPFNLGLSWGTAAGLIVYMRKCL